MPDIPSLYRKGDFSCRLKASMLYPCQCMSPMPASACPISANKLEVTHPANTRLPHSNVRLFLVRVCVLHPRSSSSGCEAIKSESILKSRTSWEMGWSGPEDPGVAAQRDGLAALVQERLHAALTDAGLLACGLRTTMLLLTALLRDPVGVNGWCNGSVKSPQYSSSHRDCHNHEACPVCR